MTIGERLLNLVSEYQESVADRFDGEFEGGHTSREPATIAADYEAGILMLIRTPD